MTPFLRKLLGLNWLLLFVMLALAIFGVIAIYSATYMREDPVAADFWRKQAQWIVVGFFAFMVASLVNYHWIRWGALPMYLAGIVFLVLTKFMGTKVYGARSWLHLGPINFQPAQLAVIAGIMVLALFLSQFKQMHPMLRLLVCGAIAGAPYRLRSSRHRQTGFVVGDQSIAYRDRFRRLVGQRVQSAEHPNRARVSSGDRRAQRLHLFRDR